MCTGSSLGELGLMAMSTAIGSFTNLPATMRLNNNKNLSNDFIIEFNQISGRPKRRAKLKPKLENIQRTWFLVLINVF